MRLPAFDPNGMPLTPGIRLLEASAGTGKTFALAHLVLRLLSEGAKPLQLSELLVVTYTDAAAAELRDRIARRLQDALNLLEAVHPDAAAKADEPLAQWLAAQGPEPSVALQGRLLLALEQLDRADITTIHGFCRRTLQRHALEAGLGPAVALERDAAVRRSQLVHDYWQQHLLPLPPGLLAGLQQRQIAPDTLETLLTSLDSDPALELDPLPAGLQADAPLAPQLQARWEATWQHFTGLWEANAETLETAFAAAAESLRQNGCQYKPYRLKPKPDKLTRVQQWLEGLEGPADYAAVLEQSDLRSYFHPGTFTKVMAPAFGESVNLPERPLLEAIAALVDGPAEWQLLHFAHWSRQELARRRERSGEMGFGQLLERLDPGETSDHEGGGEQSHQPAHQRAALIQAIARRYRAALVDEFQDTDPIQWRILRQAFSATPARHLLVMVGDPKQAIYRFRGGELATYRQAAAAADQRFGLFENRRSSPELVRGLNALMAPGLQRSQLPVPEVASQASHGSLRLPASEAPLQLLPLEPDALERQVASFCQQLLERELLLEEATGARPLLPQDICLLVNRHSQAEALRLALERRGLPSRLVSKGDVFASEAATALQRLLDALADPSDPGRRRLLAASPLLGWSAPQIQSASGSQWDALAERLARLGQQLPRLGLTAVLSQWLGTDGLARFGLRGRALADIQQAAELVQEQMHRQALGAAAAADWLRSLRLIEEREPPEEHLCRSEAAESAIAVVTVHRSKGLEYPVVICPYLWKGPAAIRAGTNRLGRRWLPPGQTRPRLDLHLNPHWGVGRQAAQQDLEAQQQEAERLAYVACTRARHLLVLGWPGADQADDANPLSPWLLAGDKPRDLPLHWLTASATASSDRPWRPRPSEGALQLGPRPSQPLENSWSRASYSAWAHTQAALPPLASEEGRDTDALSRDGEAEACGDTANPTWPPLGPLAHFPRGAAAGDALHRMLERVHYPSLAAGDTAACEPLVQRELERAGMDASWREPLLQALLDLVQTPLGGALERFRLGDLPSGGWLNEMTFDLPLALRREPGPRHLVRASGLAAVFAQHPDGRFGSTYAHQLQELAVGSRGFLTGSIDLVFRQGERWWVADWKSNWLGRRDAQGTVVSCGPNDYHQEAMAALMTTNHYPLQAHLYLVALHRYLRWRLPHYEPSRHLGGYAYVFLRGVPGTSAAALQAENAQTPTPGVLVEAAPVQRILSLDTLLREGKP